MTTDPQAAKFSKKALELKIISSYVLILQTPQHVEGDRIVTLDRHGTYEIRLVECPRHLDTLLFWVELFDHDTNLTLDSYGGRDLNAATLAAEAFIEMAMHLNKS